MATSPKSRGWCFTLNNPFDHGVIPGDFITLLDNFIRKGKIVYWIFQYEIGEQGTEHYQGYLHTKRAVPKQYLINKISNVASFRPAKGSPKHNKAYCSKLDTRIDGETAEVGPWEGGDINQCGQGARTDVVAFVRDIRNGATDRQLLEGHPSLFLRLGANVQRVRNADMGQRMGPPSVILFQGPSGCGKTRSAFEYAQKRNLTVYKRTGMGEWFEGYQGQDVTILDEVDKYEEQGFSLGLLLSILDRYPVRVAIKGSSIEMVSTTMVLTAVNGVRDWYKDYEAGPQIERRITHFFYWNSDTQKWENRMDNLYRPPKSETCEPELIVLSDDDE